MAAIPKDPGNLYFDHDLVTNIPALISRYGRDEFNSPYRSTVPLLALIKDGWPIVQEILTTCKLPDATELHFEFQVQPRQGMGKASHTDLMAISDTTTLAIEAKWTEPLYDTVGVWLQKGRDPDNRREVMAGWVKLLQPHSRRQLSLSDFTRTVYQLVHRAASACSGNAKPQLAYLQFTPLPNGGLPSTDLSDSLKELHRLLGSPSDFPFWTIRVQIMSTNAFRRIEGLSKGRPETGNAVRAALLESKLFEFVSHEIRMIN